MADDLKLDTLPELMAALVKLAADTKLLAAAMKKAANVAGTLDNPTFAFCHRLAVCLTDLGHQLGTLELPAKFRSA